MLPLNPSTTPSVPPQSGGSAWIHLFDGSASFDPSAGADEQFARSVPARWVVYLMTDAEDRPVQLLCVRNLRQSLKRRLGIVLPDSHVTATVIDPAPEGEQDVTPPPTETAAAVVPLSKRIEYRELVRHVYWTRVDSNFEADLVYLGAARTIFPDSYESLVGFRASWFLHVDPDAEFPRFVRTTDLSPRPGVLVGPIEDKSSAAKLIEMVESAFDLCRYHNILTEAPQGKPCAYKEMGRCPAPCDGSVSLEQYRRMVELAVRVLIDPADSVRAHEGRMRQAAAELKFELASRIKQYVTELGAFGKGSYRHTRKLEDFQFVALQPGPKAGSVKVFLVTPGRVHEEAGLLAEPLATGDGGALVARLLETAESQALTASLSPDPKAAGERLAVTAAHLFSTKPTGGVFVHLSDLNERTLGKAYREVTKQAEVTVEGGVLLEDEGILKEMR